VGAWIETGALCIPCRHNDETRKVLLVNYEKREQGEIGHPYTGTVFALTHNEISTILPAAKSNF